MCGSNRGAHKTVIPSQCDHVPNNKGQRAPSQNYSQWCAAGFPARPNHERRGGRQQAKQMAMPNTMGLLNQWRPNNGPHGSIARRTPNP